MTQTELVPWNIIPFHRYEPPQPPPAEVVRKGLQGLLAQFSRRKEYRFGVADLNDLSNVPPYLLNRIAATPSPAVYLSALRQAYDGWVSQEHPLNPVQVVVYPPMGFMLDSLIEWAREHDWWVMERPAAQDILTGGAGWLAEYERNPHKELLIPDLATQFLRHHNGLDLVRGLLNWLWLRQRHCLIGCSSWAWAYLSKALHINTILPQPMVPAPADARLLENWFELQAEKSDKFGVRFRQVKNGKPVFVTEGIDGEGGGEYLKRLAALCRGNAGVAWSVWRVSLQYGMDGKLDDRVASSAQSDPTTIWVKDIDKLELPQVPSMSQEVVFILHGILLHSGLSMNDLIAILPLAETDVMQTLQLLTASQVIDEIDGKWQVSPLAYPAVRQALMLEGTLSDGF